MQRPPGLFDRSTWGYSKPVIDPDVIIRHWQVSTEPGAIAGNLLLAMLVALILGISGIVMTRLAAMDEPFVKKIFARLPLQALITVFLFWLLHRLVPSAFAQDGMAIAPTSLLQIPIYALAFFVIVGTSNYLFNALLSEGQTMTISSRISERGWFIALLLLAYGVVGAHINPDFSLLPGRELGIVLVAVLAIIVSVCCKDLVLFLLAKSQEFPSRFRAHLGGFAIALVCIALSRTFNLNPGYIYGVPVGLLILATAFREREGYFEFLGILWLLAMAIIAWSVGEFFEEFPVLFDLCNVLFVILIEDAFFELLPLPMLAGGAIFQWKKLLWFVQFVTVLFFLFHVLFNPQGTVMSIAQSPPTATAMMLLGCYAIGVILLWMYVVWKRR